MIMYNFGANIQASSTDVANTYRNAMTTSFRKPIDPNVIGIETTNVTNNDSIEKNKNFASL